MSRYQKVGVKPETPDQKLARLFEEGAVIQMHHPSKGIRFIANTSTAIEWARRRGYEDVEYVEESVKRPVVRPKSEASKDDAAKSAAKKAASKGGE